MLTEGKTQQDEGEDFIEDFLDDSMELQESNTLSGTMKESRLSKPNKQIVMNSANKDSPDGKQ
jgi:hypothetical protein